MTDVKELALKFEAIKVSMSQDKNGTNLRLCIHPDDVPQELHKDWVGSRYMVAMVKIDEEDKPVVSEEQLEGQRLMKSAIMCCKEPEFWDLEPFFPHVKSEEECATALKDYLGIASRREIKTNKDVQKRFKVILSDYMESKKSSI
jgi:hypothetical protein|tara:strand:+ start:421 stop:855 length:435 start_codon:yes stop_codon:yes gene_type:complete